MLSIHFLILVFIALGLAYFFTGLYLLAQKHPQKQKSLSLPAVAVLIAMRDEEENIGNCLQTLTKQDYPAHLFDVYVLDDRSTDRSKQIVQKFTEKRNNFHLISITEDKYDLRGKMNVLALGMEATDQEIVLITDADCVVPPAWISTYIAYFSEQTGMVSGLTSLTPTSETAVSGYQKNIFAEMQTLDWLYLQAMAAGASQAGKPITILGNNFGFRRSAYEAVGGFKTLGFSITEDFILMKAIAEQTNWEISHTTDKGNTIFSQPVKTFGSYIKQRLRWTQGGRGARPFAYLIVALSLLAHLAVLLIFILKIWKGTTALAIGLIVGMDFFIIRRMTQLLDLKQLNSKFWLFEGFYIFTLFLFSALTFLPLKIKWKSRTF